MFLFFIAQFRWGDRDVNRGRHVTAADGKTNFLAFRDPDMAGSREKGPRSVGGLIERGRGPGAVPFDPPTP